MFFMVIERFKNGDAEPVYRRFREQGRMLPEGLQYIDSWVEEGLGRCFQLMECEDEQLIQQWVEKWEDLVDFEVIPVMKSAEAAQLTGGGG